MIVAAVVCPHPPLLLRELTGAEDVAAGLRAVCRGTIRDALASVDVVVAVGGADRTGSWDPSLPLGLRRFGTAEPADAVSLPPSLGVGRRLLEEAGWTGEVRLRAVAWDATGDDLAGLGREVVGGDGERVLLLVLADGSARRGEKAPGHLDRRAFGYDDETVRALAEGDAEVLLRRDAALAAELLAGGRAALGVLGAAVLAAGGRPRARIVHREDPFGVDYVVATWALRGEAAPAALSGGA